MGNAPMKVMDFDEALATVMEHAARVGGAWSGASGAARERERVSGGGGDGGPGPAAV